MYSVLEENDASQNKAVLAPVNSQRIGTATALLKDYRDVPYDSLLPTLEDKADFINRLAHSEQVNLLDAMLRLYLLNRNMVSRVNSRVLQCCMIAYYLWDSQLDALQIKQFVLANFDYSQDWDFNRFFRPKDWCEQGWLDRTGHKRENGNGRPATVYRLSEKTLAKLEEAIALDIIPSKARLSVE